MGNDAPLHPDVEELMRLVPPPVHPIGVADDHLWQKAEAAAQTEYPLELKQLNQVYGSGFIDDFLWILNPAPQIDAYNLFTYGADRDIAAAGIRPVLPTVTPESLLPIGWTTAGHELFHVTNTERPWKLVLLGARGWGAEVYSVTLPGLVAGVLADQIYSHLLKGQFHKGAHSFE